VIAGLIDELALVITPPIVQSRRAVSEVTAIKMNGVRVSLADCLISRSHTGFGALFQ
jgi:hypothetical protein